MAESRKSLIGLIAVVMMVGAAGQWWAAHRQGAVGEQVAQLAKAGDIRMLSSTTCAICTTTRAWFTRHDVKFDECFIENDTDCAALFEATRSPGTPVLLVRGVPQVGFNAERLRDSLSLSPGS
jgi:glutaredoxin